jgi:HipA-like protein
MKVTSAKQLSACIKDARLSQKLSQGKVAGKVGIRQDTVSSFELNPESTKLETLFKILAALELSLDIRPRTDPPENAIAWLEGGVVMASLTVYMNGYRVGTFTKATNGAHQFQYDESWLAQGQQRPISLSMPLRQQRYQGDEAYNFFDNLLPDNPEVRNRVVARYQADQPSPSICSVALARTA